ncbi:MAG: O-antigen ligase family protein [candidate division NC10 bacterium]|nr:O-antigen ligase family protein [candidate division NC10 bacterium]
MNGERIQRSRITQQALVIGLGAGSALILGLAMVRGNWLYLTLFGALAAIPVAVRWPVQASLGVYAFLIPFDSIAVLGGGSTGPTLNKLIGVATAGILLATGVMRHRLVRPPRAALWWFLFIVWGAVTAAWALDAQTVYDRLPTAVSLLLLYLVAVSARVSEKELFSIGTLVVLGGMVAAAYACYMYSEGVLYLGATGRASLIEGERDTDPNQFATSLLLPLSLVIGRFLEARRWSERLFPLYAMLVIAAGIFLTMSRGSLLAVLVVVLAYMYHARSKWQVWVPVALLGLIVVVMPDQFYRRLEMPYETASAGRIDIWRVGLRALLDYGIIGAGLSNFPFAYDEFAGHQYGFRGYSRGAHNIYLGIWVELGIVGFFFMMAAILSQLRSVRSWRRNSTDESNSYMLAVKCACFGLLVSGFFLDIVWRKGFWFVWILLALAVSVSKNQSVSVES